MADRPLASDLSYQVLQLRRGTGQLGTPELNEVNRRRYALLRPRVLGGVKAEILHERVTGEAQPLVHEFGSESRHV